MSNGFEHFSLNPQILKAVEEQGYSTPTEIQEKAIPRILSGQQVIGIAQTGTGKTAAYILPILMRLKFTMDEGPRALILVPTKELSIQVERFQKPLQLDESTVLIIQVLAGKEWLVPPSTVRQHRQQQHLVLWECTYS